MYHPESLQLYSHFGQTRQTCTNWGGRRSQAQIHQRGTRQGDPNSPLLFRWALEDAIVPLLAAWQQRGYGFPITAQDTLSLVWYADDCIPFGKTEAETQAMIHELTEAVHQIGLEFSPSKTEYMSRQPLTTELLIGNTTVQSVGDTMRVLGSYVSMCGRCTADVNICEFP